MTAHPEPKAAPALGGIVVRAREPSDLDAIAEIASLPGVRYGTLMPSYMPPSLFTERFGTQRERYASARSVQQLAGCVPVTQQSGKSKKVKFRRACRRDFRNTLHWFAQVSLRTSPWARAFYDRARERGQSHALALRNLAAKWVKIIYRMWLTHTPYNEGLYLASLIRHRSPLIQEIQSNPNCG